MLRGDRVEIILEAEGRRSGNVDFLIREEPKHGALSEVSRIDPSSVSLVYQHGGDYGHDQDVFEIAARGPGTGMSPRAAITIKVADPPTSLQVDRLVRFDTIAAGDSGERRLTLLNTGGRAVEGKITVPEPWLIIPPKDAAYNLEPEEELTVIVRYAPQEPGRHEGEIRYGSEAELSTRLTGLALEPVVVQTERIVLREPVDSVRGEIALENRSPRERIITVALPDFLQPVEPGRNDPGEAPKEEEPRAHRVVLPPGERVNWPVEINPKTATAQALTGEIILREEDGGNQKWSIPVTVQPLPPDLRLDVLALDFGDVELGDEKVLKVEVFNAGGVEAVVDATVEDPFSLMMDGQSLAESRQLRIEPGAAMGIVVQAAAERPGVFSAELKLTPINWSEASRTIKLLLSAVREAATADESAASDATSDEREGSLSDNSALREITKDGGRFVRRNAQLVRERLAEQRAAEEAPDGGGLRPMDEAELERLEFLAANQRQLSWPEAITEVELERKNDGTGELHWQDIGQGGLSYLIEGRYVKRSEAGRLAFAWAPFDDVTITGPDADSQMTADLGQLPPRDRGAFIRVSARLPDGKIIPLSQVFEITGFPGKSRGLGGWMAAAAAGAVVLFGGIAAGGVWWALRRAPWAKSVRTSASRQSSRPAAKPSIPPSAKKTARIRPPAAEPSK